MVLKYERMNDFIFPNDSFHPFLSLYPVTLQITIYSRIYFCSHVCAENTGEMHKCVFMSFSIDISGFQLAIYVSSIKSRNSNLKFKMSSRAFIRYLHNAY